MPHLPNAQLIKTRLNSCEWCNSRLCLQSLTNMTNLRGNLDLWGKFCNQTDSVRTLFELVTMLTTANWGVIYHISMSSVKRFWKLNGLKYHMNDILASSDLTAQKSEPQAHCPWVEHIVSFKAWPQTRTGTVSTRDRAQCQKPSHSQHLSLMDRWCWRLVCDLWYINLYSWHHHWDN